MKLLSVLVFFVCVLPAKAQASEQVGHIDSLIRVASDRRVFNGNITVPQHGPELSKFSAVPTNSMRKPVITKSKSDGTLRHLNSPIPLQVTPPILSASTTNKSYHLSDTAAQMITALNYTVTTSLTVSTTIN